MDAEHLYFGNIYTYRLHTYSLKDEREVAVMNCNPHPMLGVAISDRFICVSSPHVQVYDRILRKELTQFGQVEAATQVSIEGRSIFTGSLSISFESQLSAHLVVRSGRVK